ncbi:hypothetical protein N7510_006004 [Penicillium lagena]|uniref:uncharacterized protein n=1 Tax=Penicillium lagena TaxID=94218 RepID=UPI0025412D81|nr:uncharacterized protein N7510_006004 [Penicillium lagena]KAJ5612810.1 hypothetical protein N7510_006004 [Penicillium lagena]
MFLSTARQTVPASHFVSGRFQLTTLSRRAYSTPSRPPPPPPRPSSSPPIPTARISRSSQSSPSSASAQDPTSS